MAIRVKEVAFIYHPVADMAKARPFYEGLLGLKPASQFEFSPGVWWVEYDIAGTILAVTNTRPLDVKAGGSVALEVEDIESALADVRSAGVTVEVDLQVTRVCRMFKAVSPDGHGIIFHQRKARQHA